MLCLNCTNKLICKHYDYILNSKDITADISSCISYKLLGADMQLTPKESKVELPEQINLGMREFKNYQKDIKTNSDFKIIAEPTKLVKCLNESCQTETYEEDLMKCNKCQTDICSSCSYVHVEYDPDINEDIIEGSICETCWLGLDSEEIENKTKKNEEIEKLGFDINDYLDVESETERIEI